MSRKAVSLKALIERTGGEVSQSAACRGRLSARPACCQRRAGRSLNPLHVAEGCQPRNPARRAGPDCLNPLHVAEGCQPRWPLGHDYSRGLNPLLVAEGCQPRRDSSLMRTASSLNPLHVAEGCQPQTGFLVPPGCWHCREHCQQPGVSIRCMSRKAVSLAFSNGTNVLRSQSAACRGRLSALASLLVAATPAMASLNPLHVAEGCQPDLDNNRHRFGGGGLNPLHVAEGCQPGEIVGNL